MADLKARFGKLVAENRKRLGLTQDALAGRAHLSVDMVKRLETGRVGASFDAIERLQLALEIEASELFKSDTDPIYSRPALADLVVALSKMSDEELRWVKSLMDVVARRP